MSILVISISLIYVYRYYTRASDKFVTVSSRGFKPSVVELRKGRIPLFIIVLFISALLILLPVVVLFYTSLVPYVMVPGAKAFAAMSWDNWKTVIKDPISVRSLKNSLFLGIAGATVGSFLSVLVAYVIVKVKTKAAGVLESISFLSFSFPGIVIGIGFMWYFVRTPLYATIWALFFGYIATYLPYGIRPMTSAFIQIHGSLEESSLVCGASLHDDAAPSFSRFLFGICFAWILLATMFSGAFHLGRSFPSGNRERWRFRSSALQRGWPVGQAQRPWSDHDFRLHCDGSCGEPSAPTSNPGR